MAKRNRRSRADILAKRASEAELRARGPITGTLLGDQPIEKFPADVRALADQLEAFGGKLQDRGWAYDDLGDLELFSWIRTTDAGDQVTVSVVCTDDDYAPLAPERWKVGVEVLPSEESAEPRHVASSWDAFWRDLDSIEDGQLPAARR